MRCGKMWTSIILIAALLFMLFISGCGSKDAQEQNQSKKVDPGGQFIYGSLQEPNILNPLLSDFFATSEVGSLIFSGLLVVNEKGEYLPDLAAEIPNRKNGGLSSDGLTIIYKLRQGVTWHDGIPFSSADVKFTWETIMNPQNNIVSRDGYEKITSIDTPDAYTVVIHFREYYAPYLTLFPVILPQHILANAGDMNKAAFNRAPVGTGPFKLKEWRIAEAIILEANPNYFRGKPNLDTIIYKILPDVNIMLSQMKTGELDVAGNINPAILEQVKDISGFQTLMVPSVIWEHLDFNLDNALFQDVRVRQAILLGIDRQAILGTVLKGAAVLAPGDQPPTSWAYNSAAKVASRDINAARDLLVQAGWKQGPDGIFVQNGQRLTFTLVTTSGNKTRETIAQLIAQQLNEVGIAMNVKLVDPQALFNEILKNRRFEASVYAWVAGLDPGNSGLWNSKNIPGPANGYQGQNYCGWRNPEVDSLTQLAERSTEIEPRRQAYFRIQDLIGTEVPVIPLYFRSNINAVRETVVNYKPNPTQTGNLWNAWEWGLTKKR